MGNYYAADFDPWANNIRRIGTMLATMPERRALMQERQQLANLREVQQQEAIARTGDFNASARKLNAEAADTEGETESGNRLAGALKRVMANPNDTDATGDAISEFGHYFKKNPEQASKGMGDLLSHFMAMQGNTDFAAQGSLQGNAATIANNEANNARIMATPMVLPDNAVLADKTTGNTLAAGLQRLAPGQRLFAPKQFQLTYDTQPAAQGAPAAPHTSAAESEFNQAVKDIMLKNPDDPLKQQQLIKRYKAQTGYKTAADLAASTPDTPGTIVPISAAVASASPTSAVANAAPGPGQPQPANESPDDLIPVTNPQGKAVRIKRSQLNDALAQGYKTR
jgi:hypothetical protein